MPKQRGDTGQYVETVSLEDVLAVFGAVDGPPVVTTADVAEATGLSRDSARRKLDELELRGAVDHRRTAGRVLYWPTATDVGHAATRDWLNELLGTEDREAWEEHAAEGPHPSEAAAGAGQEPAAEDISASGSSAAGDQEELADRTAEAREADTADLTPLEDLDADQDALAAVEFPEGRDPAECAAAVYAARDYIRSQGGATMRELVVNVLPEHPVGYDVPELEEGDRYRGAWWRRVVKPGLEALPDIEKPPRGGSEWRYVGDDGGSDQ